MGEKVTAATSAMKDTQNSMDAAVAQMNKELIVVGICRKCSGNALDKKSKKQYCMVILAVRQELLPC